MGTLRWHHSGRAVMPLPGARNALCMPYAVLICRWSSQGPSPPTPRASLAASSDLCLSQVVGGSPCSAPAVPQQD